MERDRLKRTFLKQVRISTHTLTWSVTWEIKNYPHAPCISTHTLTWSVTFINFATQLTLEISTHTLTWSVTWRKIATSTWMNISTHTLTWSVTETSSFYDGENKFQLTRSRGA